MVALVEYEGAPLGLRVRVGAGGDEQRAGHKWLAIVVHQLDEVRPDGLPEAQYNDTLADFDADVIAVLESSGQAVVVLVETFQGERSYYAYASAPGHSERAVAELAGRYPRNRLEAFSKSDPEWSLWQEYRSRWPW